MSNETENSNLNYLIDPTFTNVNRLCHLKIKMKMLGLLSKKYHLLSVEIKDFNELIDRKPFFEIPIKNKEQAYEANIEMSRNNDYIQQAIYQIMNIFQNIID